MGEVWPAQGPTGQTATKISDVGFLVQKSKHCFPLESSRNLQAWMDGKCWDPFFPQNGLPGGQGSSHMEAGHVPAHFSVRKPTPETATGTGTRPSPHPSPPKAPSASHHVSPEPPLPASRPLANQLSSPAPPANQRAAPRERVGAPLEEARE